MIDDKIAKSHIQAMVVIAGGKFPYLEGAQAGKTSAELKGEIDLGIEFT